ncbi:MAG: ATP-dependent zinc metalloprotease FtsH [Acidobacteriota bacterium]|nr:ATP-dependent zinc metalloprotease FtsH [Acidobacteriota bacterium]
MNKQNPVVLILVAMACAYAIWMVPKLSGQVHVKKFDNLGEFYAGLKAGHFSELTIVGERQVRGKFATQAQGQYDASYDEFVADVVLDAGTIREITEMAPQTTKVSISHGLWADRLLQLAGNVIIPLAILIFLWVFFTRQMRMGGGQALSFGRSQAKLLGDNFEKVTFDDVAGMREVKEELQEVVEFLKYPEKFRALGAKIPRGVLLVGPPGCGKTLLARAVAGEANCAFFYISGSDFVEMFVGVGASRVRDLFDQAKQHLPAIIFIDELDAVGRLRGAGLGGGHDEREQTLNALLVEMDGFDPNADIIILAATNRPDILDPALLRPGRFDRRVVVDNPDVGEREAILNIYAKDKPIGEDVEIRTLARRTPGFSGADIENLVNEAALLAARRDKKSINMPEFDEAIERVIAGPERRSRVIRENERRILAYHEAGHALVGCMLPDFDRTYKVTILPRGMALGYTISLPEDDRYLVTRHELISRATQALGGRAAEALVFDDITTGAANDIEKVTEMARQMVTEFGMSEVLGPLAYGKRHGPIFLARDLAEERNYSEDVAQQIDLEIRRIVDQAYDAAKAILVEHRDKLDALVEVLLEKESLDQEEVEAIVKTGRLPEPESAEQPVRRTADQPPAEPAAPPVAPPGRPAGAPKPISPE